MARDKETKLSMSQTMTVQLSKCRENHLDIYILAATVVSIDGQSCACFSTLTTQGPVQPLQQAAINLTRTFTCCGLSPDKYSRPVCLEVNHTRVEGPQLLAVVSLPWGELGARQDLPQVNGYCHLVGVRSRLHLILFPCEHSAPPLYWWCSGAPLFGNLPVSPTLYK